MSVRRTATAIVVLTTLLLALAAPAGAATETTSRGTAATTSVPLHIEALGLPVDLGEVALMATTDSDTDSRAPWSMVGLTLANIDGARFGDLQVASDGMTNNPGQTFGEDTALGSVGATVANLLAIADDTAGSATSAVTSLDATATVLNDLGLEATLTDVVSSVDDTGAAATHSLAVAGVDLDLAHLLGSVLDTLPLEDLLALAGQLGVEIPVNLDPVDGVVGATEELVAAVTAVVTSSDAIVSATEALTTAATDVSDLTTLLSTLQGLDPIEAGTLAGDITTLLGIITGDATYGALGCTVDAITVASSVADVQTALDQMIACVTDAITTALDVELTALQTAVSDYVAALADVATAVTDGEAAAGALTISDILADIEALLADLLAADLGAVGPIEVTQQVRAVGSSLDASSASHTCRVTTVQALTEAPVEITDCDGSSELDAVIETITTTMSALLDTVGGVDAGNGVSLELFGTVESLVAETDDDFVRATSVMEVLRLTIPDITITACDIADGLVCALGIDIDDTLATVLGGLATQLSDAVSAANGAITATAVTDLLDSIGLGDLVTDVTGASVPDVSGVVTSLTTKLNSLLAALGDLGTGGGTVVPGAEIVVDPQLEAEHQVVAASVDNPTPANPAPGGPGDDDPSLPNTGGGAALLAVLALGAGTWLWRSRRREA